MAISNDTITAVATLIGSCTAFATVVVSGILRYQDRAHKKDDNDDDYTAEEHQLEEALEALRRKHKRKNDGRFNREATA